MINVRANIKKYIGYYEMYTLYKRWQTIAFRYLYNLSNSFISVIAPAAVAQR